MIELTVEMLEKLIEKTGASFKDAKKALLDAEGDLEKALASLLPETEPAAAENEDDTEPAQECEFEAEKSAASKEPDSTDEAPATAYEAAKKKGKKNIVDKDKVNEAVTDVVEKLKALVNTGNIDRIVISRGGETLLNVPVNAGLIGGAIGLIAAPWVVVVAAIAAYGTKCKIEVIHKDGSRESVEDTEADVSDEYVDSDISDEDISDEEVCICVAEDDEDDDDGEAGDDAEEKPCCVDKTDKAEDCAEGKSCCVDAEPEEKECSCEDEAPAAAEAATGSEASTEL